MDSGPRVTGSAPGSLRTLDVGPLTWVGGVDADKVDRVAARTGVSAGFTGCVRNLKLARRPVSLSPSSSSSGSVVDPRVKMRRGLLDCDDHPCVRLPCENGGDCDAAADGGGGGRGGGGFVCRCKPDFTGRRCQRRRNACNPNPCKNRGRCQVSQGESADVAFRCACAEGFSGRLCEGEERNGTANASSSSSSDRFKKSPAYSGPRQKLSFGIRTNVTGSRLFDAKLGLGSRRHHRKKELLRFSADSSGRLSVSVVDKSAAAATADVVVSDGAWHRVSVSSLHGWMKVEVDGEAAVLPGQWDDVRFHNLVDFGKRCKPLLQEILIMFKKKKKTHDLSYYRHHRS